MQQIFTGSVATPSFSMHDYAEHCPAVNISMLNVYIFNVDSLRHCIYSAKWRICDITQIWYYMVEFVANSFQINVTYFLWIPKLTIWVLRGDQL